eukprot:CAMPEP_0114439394 /NCGR_PEP_ID=MMETSP0103-20121206/15173_1 /TAXON_ID=37642 ORGANISM="Paraphysomonas imperforata, Strain PA2" /NCGR_SAMPLE_ID=MMETSP0103 /ASSEMBLY_ACC=CAM_ASM_000201 /LENGTH=68 /DNA_ID=CAMNT_0001610149 /DNA_START=115 /DNA_END=321 /DNA_ORIENTATION=+
MPFSRFFTNRGAPMMSSSVSGDWSMGQHPPELIASSMDALEKVCSQASLRSTTGSMNGSRVTGSFISS